jgi:hypothetical protein
MTFEQWCKALKHMLAFYGFGSGHVLNQQELEYCWKRGWSHHTAYDISCDVANGWTFEEAIAARTSSSNAAHR